MQQPTKIEISTWTIIKFFVILLALYLLFMIKDILALFLIVLILVATFSSTVDRWSKKISRPGAVAAVLLIILAIIGFAIYLIIPPLVSQTVQLAQNVPDFLNRFSLLRDNLPQIKSGLSSFSGQLGNLSNSLISFTTSIFGGIVAIVMVLVLFVYLLLDEQGLKNSFLSFFPEERRSSAADLFKKIADKAGNWFRGQMTLAGAVGIAHVIGLTIIGIPYAITLAVASALFEFIPTIGPIIAGALGVIVALSLSPVKAVIVLVWYLLVQQLENAILAPKIMGKAVGLSPVIIIFAILVGAKLYGILGVVLSVPIAASVMIIIQEWGVAKNLFKAND